MGRRAGTALRLIQFFTRAIEFCCAALILALFSYFLATLASHSLSIGNWIRAVTGIAGAAVVYTLITLLTLFCVAGHPILSSIFLFLDVLFTGAFIYLAAANRDGASSCDGTVNTPLGRGSSNTNIVDNQQGGVIELAPSLRQACKMQSACLAVAIVGLLFFIASAILEALLMRHRRKARRFGPSPINGYTSGYGKTTSHHHKGGLWSRIFGRKSRRQGTDLTDNSNALPEHTHPADLHDNNRASYYTGTTTGTTAPEDTLPPTHNTPAGQPMSGVNTGYGSYGYKPEGTHEPAYTHHSEYAGAPNTGVTSPSSPVRYPPGNYRYDDGVYERS
ncbi:hypothetical protein V8F20_000485 [Naviculisporaceae sp. PSN 640]